MFLLDGSLTIQHVNKSFYKVFEKIDLEVVGYHISDFFTEVDPQNQSFQSIPATKQWNSNVLANSVGTGKDNHEFSLTINTFRDSKGPIIYLAKASNLITQSVFDEQIYQASVSDSVYKNVGNSKLLFDTLDDYFSKLGTANAYDYDILCIAIDTLQIDQSFTKGMLENNKVSSITQPILKLAEKIDINAVVEGTENSCQVDFLEKINCKYVQGFFYQPMSAHDVDSLLNKQA